MTSAAKIVDVVLSNLMRRRGVGNELKAIEHDDPETWAELRATLVEKVEAVLRDE